MRFLIICSAILAMLTSCFEKEIFRREIVFRNGTSETINMKLYVRPEVNPHQPIQDYSITEDSQTSIGGVNFTSDESAFDELMTDVVLSRDSVILIKSDSKLVFINPSLDDSLDLKSKIEAHFWNLENWFQERKNGDVIYEITEEDFDKYGIDL